MMETPPPIIEFRDGERTVPFHVAKLIAISGIDPVKYTYEEAVVATNEALTSQYLRNAQEALINRHFVDNR